MNDRVDPIVAPWHRLSWDEMLHTTLPSLLAERVPLAGYDVEVDDDSPTCRVRVFLMSEGGDVENVYDVPRPDPWGVFHMEEGAIVVPPAAEAVDLAEAEVLCCGESALIFVSDRLRTAPDERPVDTQEARRWLPLDSWLVDFVGRSDYFHARSPTRAGLLQDINWLCRHTHLRRVVIPEMKQVITDGHVGRVCVIETPEGPNIGRILTVARGAEIRDRRLVIVDDSPAGKLGLSAACIPFLEHDDLNRALMGANMMRQWLPPAEPEPALIRTGFEPDVDEFWCGHNLLTAFITWDADCFEDAIVISETTAQRMACPDPLAVGDKLSHRHGAKGVVSRILPDAEMPALPDGTAVELIFSLSSLPSRLSLGALREAALGRVAQARVEHIDVAPFESPPEEELSRTFEQAGFSSDGMVQLTLHGKPLEYRSTVGPVYWGCTVHLAKDKLHFATDASQIAECSDQHDPYWSRPQTQGELESIALRDAGAIQTIREQYNTRAVGSAEVETLRQRLASGHVEQAKAPSPQFVAFQIRLAATGIRLTLSADALRTEFAAPSEPRLNLAEPTAHPWQPEHKIDCVGRLEEIPGWDALEEANDRLARGLASSAPAGLLERSRAQLARHLASYCDRLVSPTELQFRSQVVFSARSVIAPGGELNHDQIGVPEKIAWGLFAPLAARKLGSLESVAERSPEATDALDDAMADAWVIMLRPPALSPSNFVAFHPVRVPEDAIRLHPMATLWTNADFDGDQVALFLPVTPEGQREAEQRLTLEVHCQSDPGVLRGSRTPNLGYRGWLYGDAMWGLAHLALSSEGRQQIDEVAGRPVCGERHVITNRAITEALGSDTNAIDAHERLQRLGFQVARRAGGSIGPFFGSGLDLPDKPQVSDDDTLEAYSWEVQAIFEDYTDFDNDELGPACLGRSSGARASKQHLSMLAGANVGRTKTPFSQREGQPPEQFFRFARSAWEGLHRVNQQTSAWDSVTWEGLDQLRPVQVGRGLLSRARAARRPGVVLARAASREETDTLTDPVSRLWVGLDSDDAVSQGCS